MQYEQFSSQTYFTQNYYNMPKEFWSNSLNQQLRWESATYGHL